MEINLTTLTPDTRTLSQMKEVLYDKQWSSTAPDCNLYYMYRGIEEKNNIRYDITTIPPMMLGNEFTKTKGHYHVGGYQEIYTVLEGEAIYLLQKRKEGSENEIEDVVAVNAKKGDFLVIPRFYGHITINPSPTEELKMANWVSTDCKSDYSLYEKFQGACYYYTTEGWVKNPTYINTPELRTENPQKNIPAELDFLNTK